MTKNQSLSEALSAYGLSKLPNKEDGENLWIQAIAEVEKKDASIGYAYVEKDTETLENRIVADFGNVCAINRVISYHPFCYLDSNYVPTFKNKDEKVKYLQTINKIDCSKMNVKELDREILKIAISRQLQKEKK